MAVPLLTTQDVQIVVAAVICRIVHRYYISLLQNRGTAFRTSMEMSKVKEVATIPQYVGTAVTYKFQQTYISKYSVQYVPDSVHKLSRL